MQTFTYDQLVKDWQEYFGEYPCPEICRVLEKMSNMTYKQLELFSVMLHDSSKVNESRKPSGENAKNSHT